MPRLISGIRGAVRALIVCLPALLFTYPVEAAPAVPQGGGGGRERVTLFDVTAVFDPDGVMEVSEAITLHSRGMAIRRGIIRELPTVWKRQDGKRFILRYDVLGVTRNGREEPYSVSRDGGDLLLRIGSAEVELPPGKHEYVIRYSVANHFSRFEDFDELYWNVVGNAWVFPMDAARFQLLFRDEKGGEAHLVPMLSADAYTGAYGEQKRGATASQNGSAVTTSGLGRGEGFTVAFTWPRSVLEGAPDPASRTLREYLFLPTRQTAVLWSIPALLLCWFSVCHLRMRPGRMPEVIPLFKAPAGLTPGAVRQIVRKRYDGTAFAADLLDLVSRKALVLTEDGGRPALRKSGEDANYLRERLEPEQKALVRTLFGTTRDVVRVHASDRTVLEKARRSMAARRGKEAGKMFRGKTRVLVPGLIGTLLLPVLGSILFTPDGVLAFSMIFLFVAFWGAGIVFLLFRLFRDVSGIVSFIRSLFMLLSTVPFIIALAALGFGFLPLLMEGLDLPDGYVGAFLASFLICGVFALLLPVRTAAGLERLATAKGLRLYLGTAERSRFEHLYPPEESVAHFEALLPYALALGVGKTWANRFAGYLDQTGQSAANFHDVSWSSVRAFRSYSAAASAAPVRFSGGSGGGFSSSGSGSRGGGFSGGGSGGGGGRGW